MSVTAQTPYRKFTAAPGATLFSTGFRLILASDLVIKVNGAVVTSGFTVSSLGAGAGSDVTFGTPMTGGEIVELSRSVPKTRLTDYQPLGDYDAGTVNNDFDRLVMMLQDSQFLNDLSVLLPVGDTAAPMTLPAVGDRALKFLAFDASGNAIAASGVTGSAVSTFMAAVILAVDAAAARTALAITPANIGAAESGVNNTITRLAGLTSPVIETRQIQPISASVSGNALTISASALALEFRSTALGSGAVSFIEGTPANLVISSGSTLGTINGQQSDIAVLAINNAGTIELAAVNIAGGGNFDETGVLNTTAEGGAGASDSATAVYSTTARTGVAYRLLGVIRSTQATAGTWATAPSLIQGQGGQALAAMASVGYGQSYQDVTGVGGRASGVTMYNTRSKPISASVTALVAGGGGTLSGNVNGTQIALAQNNGGSAQFMTVCLPNIGPGRTYSVTNSSGTITTWTEQF